MTLQTERIRTLDQMCAFVEGSEAVDFTGTDRESVYEFVRQALVRLDYAGLGKSDKRLVRRYLAKVAGLLRALPVDRPASRDRACRGPAQWGSGLSLRAALHAGRHSATGGDGPDVGAGHAIG